MRVFVLGLLLVGCRVVPEETDTGDTAGLETGDTDAPVDDVDADGYTVADGDCDDTNAAMHPGAAEICNDLDDNCDGNVDIAATDAPTWYDDDDGDGYGVEGIRACEQPDGAVALPGDCHDGDATIHPGAEELCTDAEDRNCDGSIAYADADEDGVAACEDCDDTDGTAFPGALEVCDGADDDCDGSIDEEATDATTWFLDADEDGFGDPAVSEVTCDTPAGYVTDATDCDDADAAINPAATEICNGVDDDCDTLADDADPGTTGGSTWYLDADTDGYGGATSVIACDGAGYTSTPGDCDDAEAAVNPSATEVCGDGVDDDCDGVAQECEVAVE